MNVRIRPAARPSQTIRHTSIVKIEVEPYHVVLHPKEGAPFRIQAVHYDSIEIDNEGAVT